MALGADREQPHTGQAPRFHASSPTMLRAVRTRAACSDDCREGPAGEAPPASTPGTATGSKRFLSDLR
ncbi:hypothetical protein N177_0397 [Lutibaculum baratangense AMV1]|uniref:Uncharacterized protein n=1 Tax=Lutibaculum baratangense AMV1 TaxID=631454 RepID=V4RLS4_9HYPH|nr:hypothetical protein N177_0397 [Lutibaculum baratangense AMV1]